MKTKQLILFAALSTAVALPAQAQKDSTKVKAGDGGPQCDAQRTELCGAT